VADDAPAAVVLVSASDEPAPCNACARAPRCAAEHLACSQFVAYTEHRPRWQVLPRVAADREKYERVLGKAKPPQRAA